MKIDCTVVFLYILISYDHLIACDWAKIVSKKSRKFAFAALIEANLPVRQWQNKA